MKTIIVTGAGKGIGKEVALKLSESHLVYAISRDISNLNPSETLKPIRFDLSVDTHELIEVLVGEGMEQIDVLINNAGALINKPFDQIEREELTYIYKVNLFAPFSLTQSALPYLKRSGHAHVVNIGSVGGVNGTSKFPGLSAYSSSKAALSCLSECLSEEYKGSISFNCLALGAVQTEMLEQAFPGYQAPISAEGMADYIVEFSLNGHKYMNGKTIMVSLSNP